MTRDLVVWVEAVLVLVVPGMLVLVAAAGLQNIDTFKLDDMQMLRMNHADAHRLLKCQTDLVYADRGVEAGKRYSYIEKAKKEKNATATQMLWNRGGYVCEDWIGIGGD